MSSYDDGPKLPDDVVVEILKRLSVKSLLRFRCVCRSWRSTIDDPRFVALHLTHSTLNASNWYVVCPYACDPPQGLCSLFPDGSLAGSFGAQIEIPFAAPGNLYCFVGSCDSLIFVVEIFRNANNWSLYLWNVFTRKYKAVIPSTPGSRFFSVDTDGGLGVGFGFDAKSNDYKIVRIFCLPNDRKPRVEVYSLCTNSWRNLDCEVPPFLAYPSPSFLKGNLHWLILKYDHLPYPTIISFDLAREVFDEMTLSKELLPMVRGRSELCVLNDLLAVCIIHGEPAGRPEGLCSIWVMSEYGVPKSWTKLYTLKAGGQVCGFRGFTRSGKLLIRKGDRERVSWDPITGQFTNLQLSMEYGLVDVVESLVSL